MHVVRIPNDEPETWAPGMPAEDAEETPRDPPQPMAVIRDTTPIEERGHVACTESARVRTLEPLCATPSGGCLSDASTSAPGSAN